MNILASHRDWVKNFTFVDTYGYILSLENLSALVWFQLGKKNIGLAHKSRFLKSSKYPKISWSNPRHVFFLSWAKDSNEREPVTNGLGVMSNFVLLIAVVPLLGWLGQVLVTL